MALAAPLLLLMSVSVWPSAAIVTGVVSLKVRLFKVMLAPRLTPASCVAPVAVENTALAVELGTSPVGVKVEPFDQLLAVPFESAMAAGARLFCPPYQ